MKWVGKMSNFLNSEVKIYLIWLIFNQEKSNYNCSIFPATKSDFPNFQSKNLPRGKLSLPLSVRHWIEGRYIDRARAKWLQKFQIFFKKLQFLRENLNFCLKLREKVTSEVLFRCEKWQKVTEDRKKWQTSEKSDSLWCLKW